MVMVTVGIPPGFAVIPSGLAAASDDGLLQNHETQGSKLVLYVGSLDAGESRFLPLQMMPSLPVEAQAARGTVYLYYNPGVRAETPPVVLTVTE
jgi:hypothetical protein